MVRFLVSIILYITLICAAFAEQENSNLSELIADLAVDGNFPKEIIPMNIKVTHPNFGGEYAMFLILWDQGQVSECHMHLSPKAATPPNTLCKVVKNKPPN